MKTRIIANIKTIYVKYIVVTLIVLSASLLSPFAPASASEPTIQLEPAQGVAGSVIQVYGSSFTPSAYTGGNSSDTDVNFAKVYFPDTDHLVITTVVDVLGGFTGYFTAGEYPAGSYRVWACDEYADEPVWTDTYLTITPSISLSKSSGYAGEVLDIKGTGYSSLSEVKLLYNGVQFFTVVTDGNGSFNANNVVIPEATGIKNTVTAVDYLGNISSAYFYSRPQKVVIDPVTSRAEEEIRLEGSGFIPGNNISVCFYNTTDIFVEVETIPAIITANNTGQFAALLTVPFCPSGTYIIEASDGINSAAASMKVTTTCYLDRFVGYPGSEVSFNGSGFLPNTITIIKYDDVPLQEVISDNLGNVSANISIPRSTIGDHLISVTDGVNTEIFVFKILSKARLDIDPVNASVGSGIRIEGFGFSPGKVARISFDNSSITEVNVDTEETFSTGFTVPVCTGGEHMITVIDGINEVGTIIKIETQPPPAVILFTPDNIRLTEPAIELVWKEVFDYSGTLYHLQIAASPDFTEESMYIDTDNLTSPTYVFTFANESSNTEYPLLLYWRVRAEDLASNKGTWSSIRILEITSPVTPWTSYTLMTEVTALGGLFIFWLVKKSKQKRNNE